MVKNVLDLDEDQFSKFEALFKKFYVDSLVYNVRIPKFIKNVIYLLDSANKVKEIVEEIKVGNSLAFVSTSDDGENITGFIIGSDGNDSVAIVSHLFIDITIPLTRHISAASLYTDFESMLKFRGAKIVRAMSASEDVMLMELLDSLGFKMTKHIGTHNQFDRSIS